MVAKDREFDKASKLWESSNPPWGIVRAVVLREPYAIALDDLNGDEREVVADVFQRQEGGWEHLTYTDDAGLPSREGGTISFWANDTVFILGYGRPGGEVGLPPEARDDSVTCDDQGWWLYVEENVVADNDGLAPPPGEWWW